MAELDIRVSYEIPTSGQELLDVAKAIDYLADRTGVAPEDIHLEEDQYDSTKIEASWKAEGLG